MAVVPNKLSFMLTANNVLVAVPQLPSSVLHMQSSTGLRAERQVGRCLIVSMAAMAMYGEGLHFLGFSYRLPRKRCLALLSVVSLYPFVQ